jgi:subtilase family serine protease
MKALLKLAVPLLATLAFAACNAGGSSSLPDANQQSAEGARPLPQWLITGSATPACAGSRVGRAQCDVLLQTGGAHPAVAGLGATTLETYYNLPSSTAGSGQTVALVDAFDNPNVSSDLTKYRSQFGLGTANFHKYNQNGQQSNYPSGSTGWGLEIDLDVQMVSAACPLCTIDLVEANSSSWSDLQKAEAEAVTLGATIVSNSYSGTGGSESSYDTPGVTYVASAGDNGYGLFDPATFQSVVAAGGTTLTLTRGKYVEKVWVDSGGGCSSTHEAKPSWQTDPKCSFRTGNDASAVAVGAAEYDSYGYGGWVTVDGTSISSPLLAGVYALAGNATSQDGGKNLWMLNASQLQNDLHAITKGGKINGCPTNLRTTYVCKVGTGQFGQYSGPDGWGSPNGVGAF